tara:strand:- start:163 stop:1101 length:939 start_codon:yes stop_codon:yes gene_type:complete
MKKIFFTIALVISFSSFGQSKKELKETIVKLKENIKLQDIQFNIQSRNLARIEDSLQQTVSKLESANSEIELLKMVIEYDVIRPIWEKTIKKNSISDYKEFADRYPKSNYADLADEKSWELAYSKNKISYYKSYLKFFPSGKNVEEAIKEITKIEISDDVSKGEISGRLPENITQVPENLIESDENIFTIINMTRDLGNKEPVKLKVSYRGNTSNGYVNGSYEISIDDCFEKSFEPGQYYFVVETLGKSDIRKYRNIEAWTLDGGSRTEELSLGVYSIPHVPEVLSNEEQVKLYKKYYKCWSQDFKNILDSY